MAGKTERWMGMTVAGSEVAVFDAQVPETGKLTIELEKTWPIQSGNRPKAYEHMFNRVAQYVREQGIKNVVIMASATTGRMQLAHLHAAEFRGVVAGGASAGGATVHLTPKSAVSNNFGDRNVGEYVDDDQFWDQEIDGVVTKARREAAMLVLAKTRPRVAE